MKKYIIVFVFVFVFLLGGVIGSAFIDIGDILDSFNPQPVYRQMMGTEFEYIAKEVQKLGYLYQQVVALQNTLEHNIESTAMMNMILGNSSFSDVIKDSGVDLSDLSKEDIEDYIKTEISNVLNEVDTVFLNIDNTLSGIDQDIKILVHNNIADKMDISVDNVLEEMFNRSKNDEGIYDYYTYDKGEKTDKEIYTEKVDKLKEKYNDYKEFFAYIDIMYGDEPVEGSLDDFINKEINNINIFDEEINTSIDKGNLNYNLKMLIALQSQANRISLKNLKANKDLNQQILILNTILTKKDLVEEYNDVKLNHFK